MDLFDKAQELEMMERQRALTQTLQSAPVIPATGKCLFCDEAVPHPRRFCDADCARGWEAEQAAKFRNHGHLPAADGLTDDLSDGFVSSE